MSPVFNTQVSVRGQSLIFLQEIDIPGLVTCSTKVAETSEPNRLSEAVLILGDDHILTSDVRSKCRCSLQVCLDSFPYEENKQNSSRGFGDHHYLALETEACYL